MAVARRSERDTARSLPGRPAGLPDRGAARDRGWTRPGRRPDSSQAASAERRGGGLGQPRVPRPARSRRPLPAQFGDCIRRRASVGGGQTGWRGRASGKGPSRRNAGPGTGGEGRRWRGSCAGGDRSPSGPRHLGAAGCGTHRTSAHRQLKSLLASRRLRREYVALVEGHPPARTGTIDAPIGRDRRNRLLMSIDTDESPGGPDALRARGAAARRLAARRAPRHRSHAPDPGPHGGDRPSGVRRSAVRHRRSVRAERQFLHAGG